MPDILYLISQVEELIKLLGLLCGCIFGPAILALLATAPIDGAGVFGFIWSLITNTFRLVWLVLSAPVRLTLWLSTYYHNYTPTPAPVTVYQYHPAPAVPVFITPVNQVLPPPSSAEPEPETPPSQAETQPDPNIFDKTRFSLFE